MLKAIRQHVTVGPDGVVQIQSSELSTGSIVEVIVLIEEPPKADPATIAARLKAFHKLQKELNLTEESAARWMREVQEEREAMTDRILRRERDRTESVD